MNRIATASSGQGIVAPKPRVKGDLAGAAAEAALDLGSGSGIGEAGTPFLAWSFWSAAWPRSLGKGCWMCLSTKGRFPGVAMDTITWSPSFHLAEGKVYVTLGRWGCFLRSRPP